MTLTFQAHDITGRAIGVGTGLWWASGATYGDYTLISATVPWATEVNSGSAVGPSSAGPWFYPYPSAATSEPLSAYGVEILEAGEYTLTMFLDPESMPDYDFTGADAWWVQFGVWDDSAGEWLTANLIVNPAPGPPAFVTTYGVVKTDDYSRLDPTEVWTRNDLNTWDDVGNFEAWSGRLDPGDRVVVGYGATFDITGADVRWELSHPSGVGGLYVGSIVLGTVSPSLCSDTFTFTKEWVPTDFGVDGTINFDEGAGTTQATVGVFDNGSEYLVFADGGPWTIEVDLEVVSGDEADFGGGEIFIANSTGHFTETFDLAYVGGRIQGSGTFTVDEFAPFRSYINVSAFGFLVGLDSYVHITGPCA